MNICLSVISTLILLFNDIYTVQGTNQSRVIQTSYGDFSVTEPVLLELFDHPVMQRIKKIHQYGVQSYCTKQKFEYTRHKHCVGTWAVLRRFGASLEEQIAGLLHDVSHTVFSHAGGRLYDDELGKNSYQDNIHDWYLIQQGVDKVLAKYKIALCDVSPKNKKHTMQEQDLPDLCADRIDYNLQAGLLTELLDQADIEKILNDLRFENDIWYFQDKMLAKKLGLVSLYNTLNVWGGPRVYFIDIKTAQALRRALEVSLVTRDEIHFSVDSTIWDKLIQSNDPVIQRTIDQLMRSHEITSSDSESKKPVYTKFRGIDPLIKTSEGFKRLTDVDSSYKLEYEKAKQEAAQGWHINMKDM